ncbi:MAG: hypothetical protein ABJL71_12010 [Cyclobacteriaceae bacterium]|uniref:hypothetical protein n=1 Tax=Reichenbachiella sp. TaxID=2184521 RepID=UPI0032632342
MNILLTLDPESGDDTKRIQAAIDSVAKLPVDSNGFRGVILLKKGHYTLNKSLIINSSGIVLRGEEQGKDQTVFHANLRAKHSVIQIQGFGVLEVDNSSYQKITTHHTSPLVPIH